MNDEQAWFWEMCVVVRLVSVHCLALASQSMTVGSEKKKKKEKKKVISPYRYLQILKSLRKLWPETMDMRVLNSSGVSVDT